MIKRYIKERKQDYYTKSLSKFNDKEVQLVVYEYISLSRNKLSAQKLPIAKENYLCLEIVTNTIYKILERKLILDENSIKQLLPSFQIKV